MGRIIAGLWRGRPVVMPPGSGTRPTTDRVREAVFASIVAELGTVGRPVEEQLAGFSFLDLYAGSAAVGLEAASRGAAPVRVVEADSKVVAVVRRNVATLTAGGHRGHVAVTQARVEQVLGRGADRRYDVVWLDPPYDLGNDAVTAVLGSLVAGEWLAADALVFVERSARGDGFAWPQGLTEPSARRYGETVVHSAVAADPVTSQAVVADPATSEGEPA